jgi:hypothetical protein
MRHALHRLVLLVVLQLGLLAGLASTASVAHAGDVPVALEARRLLRHDGLAVTTRNVTRMAVHAPGQYASEVLSVFKLRIGRFLPEFGIDEETLRPYLLGGRTTLRLPLGRTVGENVPGGGQAAALHIGGGAELRLRDRLFLSMDVGEVMHSGPLSSRSYTTCRMGFLLDF